MSIDNNIQQVGNILGYHFTSKNCLSEALLAPATDEEDSHGSLSLADLGIDVIRSCLSLYAYKNKIRSSHNTAIKRELCSYDHLVSVAQRTVIDRVIIDNRRPVERNPVVVAKAFAAIIAAAHLDCGGSYPRTWKILKHIGFFATDESGVDPTQLENKTSRNTYFPEACPAIGTRGATTRDMDDGLDMDRISNVNMCEIKRTGDHLISSAASTIRTGYSLQNEVQHSQRKRPMDIEFREMERNQRKQKHGRCQKDLVALFLTKEAAKCEANGLPLPREWYFTAEIEKDIHNFHNGASVDVLKRLIVGSGSSQSVLSLQEAIRGWREEGNVPCLQISDSSSKADTFKVISEIGEQIMCLKLFQRYHISYLFDACGGGQTPSLSRFVAAPAYNLSTVKRGGNPHNHAESELTNAMMRHVLPQLKPGSSEYQAKHKYVNGLRVLARRFHILQECFGKGILALIPSPGQTHQTGVELSDAKIGRVPESAFLDLVSILNRSQGDFLRQLSTAAWKIVETMLYQPTHLCPLFQLETIESSFILEQPKELDTILQLLK
ncbi:hypothetical protein BDV26DRAFT_295605 [Aspergillus bertholletiae]|uniref:RNase III domain-containing protein n=1 Tax=Aspergillus bertholletiae TaxID=1226010 RepID=A0A5N7AYB5_9EURO|nr:hypothetical protein BDV26DRAFT_295605 [Aspergillus bertholletiae]